MKSKAGAFLLTIFLLVCSGQAFALRCGTKLVDIGDRKHKVLYKCGEPDYKDSYDQISPFYPYPAEQIDVWTYNFGSNLFMQELIFRNGILRRINKLGYGYR